MAGEPLATVALSPPALWAPSVIGAAAATPVPSRDTVCGLPGALSDMVSWPPRSPVAVGVKLTLITHDVDIAKDAPQLFV